MGGVSRFSDEGVSPVTSIVGALGHGGVGVGAGPHGGPGIEGHSHIGGFSGDVGGGSVHGPSGPGGHGSGDGGYLPPKK